MNGPQETVETRQWTDRQLLLKNHYLLVELNGSVSTLKNTVFGAEALGIVGLVEQAQQNTAYRERAKAVLRIIALIGGAAVSVLATILVLLLEHML